MAGASTQKTYQEYMQEIADDFFAESGNWRATSTEIAVWAIQHQLWEPPSQITVKMCARDISRALREEYVSDSQGRSVRTKHAARITEGPSQHVFWADIRSAPREHMELAFQQRRRQIVGDCRQLKLDVDFYNSTHAEQPRLQMLFNFEEDLEEIEAAESDHTRNPRNAK
jgi:hypothetical protein